ncbi:phage antirepressor [Schaalia sp. lx-100]|uniref:phage antirepressor n=1 Tax=Schaalia sp. lx-100 TaxID=2899081 RepID=UPI001E388E94|nr:phage antirepressor [Schaalia sp. lx-100]MCD4557640.1 phage antirepressor [Schaalia sp. lx-100]
MKEKIMNQMTPFDYKGTSIRVITGSDGEPWFVVADVTRILEIGNPSQAITRLDDDERTLISNEGHDLNVVSEAGLYSLILGSRKPEAKAFKRWVTHEVLPSVRRHGAYMTPEKIEEVLLNPDTIIKIATELKKEQAKRRELEAQAAIDAPKVLFADSVATSKTSILVGDLAKILKGNGVDIGGQRLFNWLREKGYLIKRKGSDRNMPTQRAIDLGLFEVKETAVTHADGHVTVSKTPKVTGRGQQYFVEKFLGGRGLTRRFGMTDSGRLFALKNDTAL